MYSAGWPAMLGKVGTGETPSGPWQALHSATLSRTASALPWNGSASRRSRTAAARAKGRHSSTASMHAARRGVRRLCRSIASSSQRDPQQQADHVRVVALRPTVGIDAVVDHAARIEAVVVPVADAAALVVVEQAQRDALVQREGDADVERIDAPGPRRGPADAERLVREVRERGGRREARGS